MGAKVGTRSPIRLLVFSTVEALPIAQAVQAELELSRPLIEATVWNQAQFSGWLLDEVLKKIEEYAFVVAVLSADDVVISRSRRVLSPRDNLILELGMALATNGIPRTIILRPRSHSLKLPTDLGGLLHKVYDHRSDGNWRAAVGPACAEIVADVEGQVRSGLSMSPPLFYRAVSNLSDRLIKSSRRRPDLIIGVNHGGALLGSMLYYLHRQLFHFMVFWIDVHSALRTSPQRRIDAKQELTSVVDELKRHGRVSPLIFVVDDTLRSGRAMTPALEILNEVCPSATIKIGVILFRPDLAETYNPTELRSRICIPDPKLFPTSAYDRLFYE